MESLRSYTKRNPKLAVTLGAALLLLTVRLVVPCPTVGHWRNRMLDCMCDSHNFFAISDGSVLMYSERPAGKTAWGTLQKVGWNRYEIVSGDDRSVLTFGWFRMSVTSVGMTFPGHRDLNLPRIRQTKAHCGDG